MYPLWQCDQTVGGQYESLQLVETADPLRDTLQLVTRSDEVFQLSQLANGSGDALKCQTIIWEEAKLGMCILILLMHEDQPLTRQIM